MNIKDLVVPNSFFKLHNSILDLPQNIKQIRIDVGLCAEAVNSALWLSETSDRFVMGIEPLHYHWTVLQNFDKAYTSCREYPNMKFVQLEKNSIEFNKQNISSINNRFCGFEVGVDNVTNIQQRDFYEVIWNDTRSGASSFLKLTPEHPQGNNIKGLMQVKTISLNAILNLIPWDRFDYIEHIKTDCEGYDPIVVESIGKYLDKIVFLSCEMLRKPWHHENEPDINKWLHFMQQNHFEIIYEKNGEIKFVNTNLKHKVNLDNLDNHTTGT